MLEKFRWDKQTKNVFLESNIKCQKKKKWKLEITIVLILKIDFFQGVSLKKCDLFLQKFQVFQFEYLNEKNFLVQNFHFLMSKFLK